MKLHSLMQEHCYPDNGEVSNVTDTWVQSQGIGDEIQPSQSRCLRSEENPKSTGVSEIFASVLPPSQKWEGFTSLAKLWLSLHTVWVGNKQKVSSFIFLGFEQNSEFLKSLNDSRQA